MKIRNHLLTLGILLALPLVGHAQSVIYTDSFEAPGDSDGNAPNGWTFVATGVGASSSDYAKVQEGTDTYENNPFTNLNGSLAAFIYGEGNSGDGPTALNLDFSNANVGSTFAANTTYTLTYLEALPYSYFSPDSLVSVSFEAGGTVIGSTTQTAITDGSSAFVSGPTLTFDTASSAGLVGQDIGIDVNWSYTNEYGTNIGLDDFQITATPDAVPEPSTYALLGAGLLALAFVVRRKALAR